MSLARTIKNLKRGEKLIITPRIDAWLSKNPSMVLDDELIEVFASIVMKDDNQQRSGRFGSSTRGLCLRQQIFQYCGQPAKRKVNPVLQNLYNDGNWRHLRWQMMGLAANVFTHVEVPVDVPKYRLKTSIDAVNTTEKFIFELKGMSSWTNSTLEPEIPERHNLQIHSMFVATGYDTCVYVREDKRTQEWRETVVRKDEATFRTVKKELVTLNEHVTERTLPPVLNECWAKEGAYKTCPYAQECIGWYKNGDRWPNGAWC